MMSWRAPRQLVAQSRSRRNTASATSRDIMIGQPDSVHVLFGCEEGGDNVHDSKI